MVFWKMVSFQGAEVLTLALESTSIWLTVLLSAAKQDFEVDQPTSCEWMRGSIGKQEVCYGEAIRA